MNIAGHYDLSFCPSIDTTNDIVEVENGMIAPVNCVTPLNRIG